MSSWGDLARFGADTGVDCPAQALHWSTAEVHTMRSLISFLILSGCAVETDSIPMPELEMDASAKSCINPQVYFRDMDGDGVGNHKVGRLSCVPVAGYSLRFGDCADRDATRFPGAVEICDGVDQDCDRRVDDDAIDAATWYADGDEDGYGDATVSAVACRAPDGMVADNTDCADNSAQISPGSPEFCDNLDNDCDDAVDDDPVDANNWYKDQDGDGYGLAGLAFVGCTAPDGFTTKEGDCDDSNADTHPMADELCDRLDNNCDGDLDENVVDGITWYPDIDGDGAGDANSPKQSCEAPPDSALEGTDCDDQNALIYPEMVELCDQQDNNCNGTTDEAAVDALPIYLDDDGDGFGDAMAVAYSCSIDAGYVANAFDCNDADPLVPLYVDAAGQDGAAGTLDDPLSRIQDAVDQQAACIMVGPGRFYENLYLESYNGAILSSTGSADTIVQGNGSGPVVRVRDSNVQLDGFTIQGGGPDDWTFVVGQAGCWAMQAGLGGGIHAEYSILNLADLVIRENDVRTGSSGDPNCSEVSISSGGGLYAESSQLEVNMVLFQDNRAEQTASMELIDSDLQGSRLGILGTGGNVYGEVDVTLNGGTFNLSNFLMLGTAHDALIANAELSLSQVTLGGYELALHTERPATLTQAILMSNGTALSGAWTVSYSDLYDNGESGLDEATVGAGMLSADPLLVQWTPDRDSSNDNFSLAYGSPAMDAGRPGVFDVDGSPADLGALGGPQGW